MTNFSSPDGTRSTAQSSPTQHLSRRAVGRLDVAALPIDDTLRPRPLGGEVAAVQDEDPLFRIEEEFGHLGRRRLLDHRGVVKGRRQGDDILIGDGHRSCSLPGP